MTAQEAYQQLRARMKDISLVESVGGVLYWDREAYMPRKADDYRGEQISKGYRHVPPGIPPGTHTAGSPGIGIILERVVHPLRHRPEGVADEIDCLLDDREFLPPTEEVIFRSRSRALRQCTPRVRIPHGGKPTAGYFGGTGLEKTSSDKLLL